MLVDSGRTGQCSVEVAPTSADFGAHVGHFRAENGLNPSEFDRFGPHSTEFERPHNDLGWTSFQNYDRDILSCFWHRPRHARTATSGDGAAAGAAARAVPLRAVVDIPAALPCGTVRAPDRDATLHLPERRRRSVSCHKCCCGQMQGNVGESGGQRSMSKTRGLHSRSETSILPHSNQNEGSASAGPVRCARS